MCLAAAGLLAIAGPLQVSAQTRGEAVGNPERGARTAAAKCAGCHGLDGNSPDPRYPKLADQSPSYLYWQLWAFKQGDRRSDVMAGIATGLSDDEMADAASFYARQARRPDPIKNTEMAAIGRHIFFEGAHGTVPRCAACHGSATQRGASMGMCRMPMMGMMGHGMMGMMANAPSLGGQHAAYVVDQLNRFAAGQRQGTVMNRIAAALTDTDRKAVAEFLSGLK